MRLACIAACIACLLAARISTAQDRTVPVAPSAPTVAPGPVGAATATANKDGVRATLSLAAPRGWQPGVPVDARVSIAMPQGARAEMPSLGEMLGVWDVRDVRMGPGAAGGDSSADAGGAARAEAPASAEIRLTLVAWDAGPLTVPAIPIRVALADGAVVELAVGPLDVALESLLAADTPLTELAAPIRGPVDISTARWGLYIALAVGAIILLWLASRLFLRSRALALEPALPADVWALRELDRLEADRLPARAEFGAFFARLSDIVRHYVEQRWDISAPEQTTNEFLRVARAHPELSGGHEHTLAQFLRSADLVKFAAVRPMDSECDRALDMMRGFVRASAPVEAGATEVGHATAPPATPTPTPPLPPPPPPPPPPSNRKSTERPS